MLPNFLIVGAPRSGTTWLAKNLREHPEVFMPQEKELHFFNRHYSEGLPFYEHFFDGADRFNVVGEATPDYLYVPEVPERIHAHIPGCKMILCLRNPVDRVYSRYWNSKAKYKENRLLSFEEKLRSKPLFLEEGKYYTHLKRYYQFFAPEQFLILLFEDIQSRPDWVLSKVFDFLHVNPTFQPSRTEERINAAASKPYLAKSRIVYYLHKLLERLGFRKFAQFIADKNMAQLPPMNLATRRWLQEEVYQTENKKLNELTGIDVSAWN